MRFEEASRALGLLNRAIQQFVEVCDTVKEQAEAEYFGYIAQTAPILEGLFSMSAVIWREHPTLSPPASSAVTADEGSLPDVWPTNDEYRSANTMRTVTAERIARMAKEASALADEGAQLLRAECAEKELLVVEPAWTRAKEAIEGLRGHLADRFPAVASVQVPWHQTSP